MTTTTPTSELSSALGAVGVGAPAFYFLEDGATRAGHLRDGLATPPVRLPRWDQPRDPVGLADTGRPLFDVATLRRDFPLLRERVHGKPLVWFDNAATTQKPLAVINRLTQFYTHESSNIHRAAHDLAARATDAYEEARETVRRFVNASSVEEIIFVRGATEGVNLVAATWGEQHIGEGDEILISHLEHHANIVPWQRLALAKGARLKVLPVDDQGALRMDELPRLLNGRVRLVAVTQVSNALGTVVPVRDIIEQAHRAGACVLVDAAQSVAHLRLDVQALQPDFLVFSGHKIYGPTGIGVVWGRRDLLESLPPWQAGGNMIEDVTLEHTRYQPPPARFEAGTGNIADAVGLGEALRYVERIGLEAIDAHEHALLGQATEALQGIPGVRVIGTAPHKASVLSFLVEGWSVREVGQALNQEGIAVRAGHHCAQPILRRLGLEATVRASLAFYNTAEEVDRFAAVVRRLAGRRSVHGPVGGAGRVG
jgi:cysteine desulfurase / selenocysteine lyase